MPIKKELQLDFMDGDLRVAIWNVITRNYIPYIHSVSHPSRLKAISDLWDLYFKLAIDQIPDYGADIHQFLKDKYYVMNYNQVYDFVEFIGAHPAANMNSDEYAEDLNRAFEREYCGYRMFNGLVTKITSDSEIKSIEESANTPFSSVNEHMKMAHTHLSNRKEPDYRNSIKESISAVEAICQEITRNKNVTLGDALKIIRDERKIELPPSMREACNKLYGYTSSEDGIRHALSDESKVEFDEAKFMLVSCSAFVNYLVSKCK